MDSSKSALPPDVPLNVSPAEAAASANPAAAAGAPNPLPPGTAGAEIPIPAASFQQLLSAAAAKGNAGTQVWVKGGSELLVITGKVTDALDDGLVLINIPVSCDQLSTAVIQVPFAAGRKDSPAGMICATEDRPRGPALVVDVWGEALIAFGWRVLLTAVSRAAAQSGVDQDGAALIPAAITVTKDALTLLPMARHTFDRIIP